MTGEVVLLVVGAVLVLGAAALVRGRLGGTPRLAVGGTGLLCLIAAVILLTTGENASKGKITVTIADGLDPTQVSQRVRLFLDGRATGVITVDQKSPTARLVVRFTTLGRHHFRTETVSQLKGRKPVSIANEGDFVVDDGTRTLRLLFDDLGRTGLGP